MKDFMFLVATAAGVSLVAWAFWRFMGNDGFNAILTISLVVLTVDNLRLRRQLSAKQAD